jgi:hypothetical protein
VRFKVADPAYRSVCVGPLAICLSPMRAESSTAVYRDAPLLLANALAKIMPPGALDRCMMGRVEVLARWGEET